MNLRLIASTLATGFSAAAVVSVSVEAPKPPPLATAAAATIVEDRFSEPDGLITGPQYYVNAVFPLGGTSLPSNPSPVWEGDSGAFFRQQGWGFSGRPIDWNNRYFFRFNTRNFGILDASISWVYRSAKFGEDGYPVESSDAVDVWLRYQTQYNLYVFQFDRTNDGFQAKRKIPAKDWGGPPSLVANEGVYYTLVTDAEQPVVGPGQHFISWEAVRGVLPHEEQSKPSFPGLAHDGRTSYRFTVTVRNLPGGQVKIQAFRAGALIYSATDDGRSAIAANGETQATHLAWGYYDGVPGWQPWWGFPITHAGATGFRSDNQKIWIDDFVVTAESSGAG